MDSDDGALLYIDKALLIDKSGALRSPRSSLPRDSMSASPRSILELHCPALQSKPRTMLCSKPSNS